MSFTAVREWHYIDSIGGTQKGPIPLTILIRMLEKGIGVSAETLVWKAGMDEWLPLSKVEPFKDIVAFQSKQWYFLDSERQQQGPIGSRLLVHKLKQGDIDGLTMVYGGDLTEWKSIAEVPELKSEMQKISLEEQAAEAAAASLAASEAEQQQQQVFISDDMGTDKNAAIQSYFQSTTSTKSAAKDTDDAVDQSEKKTFVADNGVKYGWDEAEQDWVEIDSDGENDDEEHHANMVFSDEEQEADEEDDEERNIEHAHKKQKIDSRSSIQPVDGTESSTDGVAEATAKKKRSSKKKKGKKGPNTWVYVTGLPKDITTEEVKDHFSKVGLIALSPHDQQPYIKIYRDESGACKGDCSLCYNAVESVKTAIDFLDGGYIRPTHKITVTLADFTAMAAAGHTGVTGASNSSSSGGGRKAPLSHAQIKVAKSAIKQALTWNEDDDIGVSRAAALRIVVLEGMFTLSDFSGAGGDAFAQELEADVASECEKCGPIEKITVFSQNPRGIVIVKFGTSYGAQECIKLMNGRYFGGRRLSCVFWDGVTNYSIVAPTAVEESQEASRLNEFGDWLDKEQEDLPDEFKLRTE